MIELMNREMHLYLLPIESLNKICKMTIKQIIKINTRKIYKIIITIFFVMRRENIPYLARITSIADTFDAMTSKRTYRDAVPLDKVIEEFERCKGTQFDPNLADVFINIILDNKNLRLNANNDVIIEEKNKNTNININTYIDDKLIKNNDKNLKIDALQQLNYLSFSNRNEKSSPHSILSLNDNKLKSNDLLNLKDNSTLSLQKYLNCSRQKRIKFDRINKSTFCQKGEDSHNKEKENENESNLSGLENSNSLYNNNFKKVLTKYGQKMRNSRNSSEYNSTNNNKNKNINNSSEKNKKDKKDKLNKVRSGRTIDVTKINKLYNLMNLNMKGSLSGRNIKNHNKNINFNEKFFSFGSPILSPKYLNRGNLKLKKEFVWLNNNNIMNPFCLPNLMKGGNMNGAFINNKLEGKLHLNLNQNNINYKKLLNNNNKRKFGFKRSGSTGLFNHFMNNEINGGITSKNNRNKINRGDEGSQFYNNGKIIIKYQNESDIIE